MPFFRFRALVLWLHRLCRLYRLGLRCVLLCRMLFSDRIRCFIRFPGPSVTPGIAFHQGEQLLSACAVHERLKARIVHDALGLGSGDRICYHGVTDMFRNPKPAASVYAAMGDNIVLEVSSSMDIGEHPASNRGSVWIVSNADSVRMYKNDRLLKEYFPSDSPFKHLAHGPVPVDDFIGKALEEDEDFRPEKAEAAKKILNYAARYGQGYLPPAILAQAAKCVLRYRMKPGDAVILYNKYIGDWGGAATEYRFDAVKNGQVVKSIVSLKGGMGGTYVKTLPGKTGEASLTIHSLQIEPVPSDTLWYERLSHIGFVLLLR